MKIPQKQEEKLAWRDGEVIQIAGCEQPWTITETRRLLIQLKDAIKNCNVAIFKPAADLFKTADDGSVFTTYINDTDELEAARSAFDVQRSSSILPVVTAIMNYHSDQDALNIIISDGVMHTVAKSYLTFTGQFCTLLAKQTQEFLSIKAIHDFDRKQFGVFCRKSEFEMSTTFRGQLLGELRAKGKASVPIEHIPETYVLYPSTLTSFLRKRLPEFDLTLEKDKQIFNFSIKNKS